VISNIYLTLRAREEIVDWLDQRYASFETADRLLAKVDHALAAKDRSA